MTLQQKGITHWWINLFVEPMKRWLPWEVWFWRPDNNHGLFHLDKKPLGYWLGHVVGIAIPLGLILGILI